MLITVQIPDEVYQKYAARKPERPQVALADTLKEFVDLVPGTPRVVLEGEQLKKLNHLLGWPVSSVEVLLSKVAEFARASVAGVEVQLSPEQLVVLARQADFMKRTGDNAEDHFKEYVASLAKRALTGAIGV